jgi:hypothetical protein
MVAPNQTLQRTRRKLAPFIAHNLPHRACVGASEAARR